MLSGYGFPGHFESFSGQQLQGSGEQPRAANVIVDSRIVKADGKPVVIKYLMQRDGDDWQVLDVYLDGTISELAGVVRNLHRPSSIVVSTG